MRLLITGVKYDFKTEQGCKAHMGFITGINIIITDLIWCFTSTSQTFSGSKVTQPSEITRGQKRPAGFFATHKAFNSNSPLIVS